MLYRLDAFRENKINPVTGTEYDSTWMVLMVTDSHEYQSFCGSRNGCAYTIKISRHNPSWKMAVGDFIAFHEDKNCILVMAEDELNEVMRLYAGHSPKEALRAYEPRVLIHSTPLEIWEKIKQVGMLKSWSRLKREKVIDEEMPIGRSLGDPLDFSDYIMFGSGVSCEIIVSSRQAGEIRMDINREYLTGARLYFDAGKMARDGYLLRDGVHMKVRDELPLSPYLIWVASWENTGLNNRKSTPRIFTEKADAHFNARREFSG